MTPTRKIKVYIPTESEDQIAVAQYLDMIGATWCHVPNGAGMLGGKMNGSRIGKLVKLKKMGVKSGVPDILIFSPPTIINSHALGNYRGHALELKRTKGSVTSLDQKLWHANLKNAGWEVAVCKGSYAAIQQLKAWGY